MSDQVVVGVGGRVRELTRVLADAAAGLPDNVARVDLIADLEALKCAAEAAQAAAASDLYDAAVAAHEAQGVPRARRGRGAAHQVALARRESPHRGSMHLGLARAVTDLPHLRGVWAAGRITEYRASQVVAKLVHLDLEDRRSVDAALAGTPERVERLVAMSDREAVAAADAHAYARDRAGYVRRRAAAEADRHVSSRPAPDTMLRLTALLPVAAGVSVVAALRVAAEQARCAGDPRSRSQVMADTLVGRVTGRDPLTTPVPVSVEVSVPLDTLVDHGAHRDAPGWVDGYGPVPADLARSLVADAVDSGARIRRSFTDAAGQLVAMESVARCFPSGSAQFLRSRDRYCRQPWCEAPIHHADHVVPAAEGGPTSAENGQGLCEACNHAKQAPGWRAKTRHDPDGVHVVETTTPTGHTYDARPPPAHPCRE